MEPRTQAQIWTVTQLTQAIKGQLEQKFAFVQIKGEISNLKIQASGHIYFTLKDAGAAISGVLFRGNARTLSRMPKDGDEVICTGEISVYAPRGNYQLIVRQMQYSGVGDLLLKFQALKEKLTREGFFDPAHKKPLPKHPKTIGVITSPTGAVIQDILNVLKRRSPGFQLILNPVKVQGDGAALEIAKAVHQFNQMPNIDLIILGRGGGSLEDLWPFNEECVVRALYASKIPTISAVGHETDFSLSDFAADVRAPTPSAAAEISCQETAALLTNLQKMHENLTYILKQNLEKNRLKLLSITRQPLLKDPYQLLGPLMQKMDDIGPHLKQSVKIHISQKQLHVQGLKKQMSTLSPMRQIEKKREQLSSMNAQIRSKMVAQIEIKQRKDRLIHLVNHMRAIDPKNLLKKGYAIVFNQKDNSVIMSAKSLKSKDKVDMLFSDGKISAEVTNEI